MIAKLLAARLPPRILNRPNTRMPQGTTFGTARRWPSRLFSLTRINRPSESPHSVLRHRSSVPRLTRLHSIDTPPALFTEPSSLSSKVFATVLRDLLPPLRRSVFAPREAVALSDGTATVTGEPGTSFHRCTCRHSFASLSDMPSSWWRICRFHS